MIDTDLVAAAKGMAMEAVGTVIRHDDLADRGRVTQFKAVRRMQVRKAKRNWSELSWTDRAGVLARQIRP
ncbi:MAG: hypothetical protein QG597_2162 [Actinomycetota bacterium]|nr:hypothetical protein [Actinomycetota bacterium]